MTSPACLSRFLICLLAALLITVVASPTFAALPPDTVDYVIVTNGTLAPAFVPLAEARSQEGLATRVVTIAEIQAWVDPGVDIQAWVREFLRQAHEEWGCQYVLLGGDTSVVPARYARSTFYPPGGYTDIPTDLYFACLEGTWDGDGDGLYGEVTDDCDLTCDLVVGRAPVIAPQDAVAFVTKSLTPAPAASAHRALLMAESGLFGDESSAEALVPRFEAATPPWSTSRLYGNPAGYPDSEQLSRHAAFMAMNDGGYRIVHHVGHASASGLNCEDDVFTSSEAGALFNPLPFVLVAWFGQSAAFDYDPMTATLLRNPHGGAAAVIGASRSPFPAAVQTGYVLPFFSEALLPGERLGDALRATLDAVDPAVLDLNSINRWTHLVTVLLGDPTLPLIGPDVTGVATTMPSTLQVTASPNPFNPRVKIEFSLDAMAGTVPVAIDIYDLRGRHIATAMRASFGSGRHGATWDGRGNDGLAVAAGTYVARVEAGARTRMITVVCVR